MTERNAAYQANLIALADLIQGYTRGWKHQIPIASMAEFLAAHGVLAVDAISDEDAVGCFARDGWASADQLRAALRRLATGGPNG